MKRLFLLLVVLAGGCFHPGQEKLPAPEAMKPAKSNVRRITADMMNAENALKAADQVEADIDRETKK